MKIQASSLKHLLRKLSPIKTETYQLGPSGLSASDPDVWVCVEQPFELDGVVSVHGRKLTQVASRMSGDIDLSFEPRKLTLKSARAKVELETQQIKAPVLPEKPKSLVTLPLDSFKTALSLAAPYASTERSPEYGNVIQIATLPLGLEDDKPTGYRVAGMDGTVLGVATVQENLPNEFSFLLNLEAAAIVQIMDDEPFGFGITHNNIYLKSGGTTVYASASHKVFKDYDRFFPKKFAARYQIQVPEFAAALKTVEPLIDESVDKGAVSCRLTPDCVIMRSLSVGSTAEDQAACQQIEPDPVFDPRDFELCLIAKHLNTFLAKAGDEATINIVDPDSPVLLESKAVQVLTMPVRSKP